MLRAEGRDPLLSKAQSALSSPGGRVLAIVGGALGLTVALFLVLFVVGSFAG